MLKPHRNIERSVPLPLITYTSSDLHFCSSSYSMLSVLVYKRVLTDAG